MNRKIFKSKLAINALKISLLGGFIISSLIVASLYLKLEADFNKKIESDKLILSKYLQETLAAPLQFENIADIRKIVNPFLQTSLNWIVIFDLNKIPIFTSGRAPDLSRIEFLSNQIEKPSKIVLNIPVKINNLLVGNVICEIKTDDLSKDRKTFIIQIISLSIILILFFSCVLFFILSIILERIMNLTTFIAEYPSNTAKTLVTKELENQDEITSIYAEFKKAFKKEETLLISLAEKSKNEAIGVQAQQVAHDIRSPLSALNLMIPSMNVLPEDNRVIIRQAIQRINDIANDLLNKKNALDKTNEASQNIDQSTPSNAKINSSASVFLLAPVIDAIVSEKRIQYRDKINVQIDIDLTDSYGLFINFNLVELKRIISNLINNSIEALLNNSGRINVKILSNKKSVFIQITDTGQGIPPQVLKTLGNRGVSYNKENSLASGSGLGLYHAKTTIEQLGGKFEMQSELGIGTQISIGLPLSNPPEWYLDKINITEDTLVVSVDDDVSIHGIWRNRFSSLATFENQTAQAIEFLSFTSVTDFMNWYKIQEISQLKKCIFLIDYEFIQQNMNGLELVEKLNLHLNPTKPILVTSRYDDLNIQEKCRKLNMKLIPKSMSGLIPLSIEKTKNKFDWILIDDDNLIHQTWALQARETNKKFIGYLNFDEFKRNINLFNYESTIYIDSMLGRDSFGNEVKGESLAEELFLSGFENIYITTGHSPEFIKSNQYIKGVLDKNPPNFKLHPT